MNNVNDMLKELMQGGLSQAEISRRTGVPQPRLSKWNGGAVPVGADDALKLLALLRKRRIAARRAESRRAAK